MTGPITFDLIRRLALALPGVEEGTSYGTPAFRVRRKLLGRMHQEEDALVLAMDLVERDFALRADPRVFYITKHYRNFPFVLVRLSAVSPEALRDHLEQAWRRVAPKRLVADYDGRT